MAQNVSDNQRNGESGPGPPSYVPLDISAFERKVILAGTLLGLFVSATNQTVITTALPRIIGDLGGINLFAWVFTAFMLTSTTVVPLAGKLSDLFGRKPFFLGGLAILLLGSAGGGTSGSMEELVAWRALQGVGAGMLMGNAFAIIGDMFPPAERGKYQGLFTGVFGLSSVLGPLVGGTLTDHLSWRAVFYMNIPLGMVAFAMLWRFYPRKSRSGARPAVDYSGAALLTGGVVPLLLALVWGGDEYAWGSPVIISMLSFSAVSLAAFVWNESRVAEPIIPLSLFRSRFFAVATVISFVSGMGLFGAINFMPMFVQGVLGTSAAHSGLVTSPMMLSMVVASTVAGILASRTGKYRLFIISGSAGITVGMFFLSRLGIDSTVIAAVAAMIVIGLGIGLSMPIVNLVVQNSVPHQMLGVVSSSSQFFRQIGGTIGTAIFGTLVTRLLQSNLERELTPELIEATPPQMIPTLQEPRTLMNPEELALLREGYADLGPAGVGLYELAVDAMRISLSDSLGAVFLFGVVVTGIGLLISFFMPEPTTPLRRSWGEEPVSRHPGTDGAEVEQRREREPAL